ncbi:MAG: preprotein translocase subunit SecE [Anaerorhabdus sp.]
MKWFSLEGIIKETKRIRWPHANELLLNTAEVLLFVCFFGVFFVLCEFGITFFLRLIGIGG